MATSIWDGGGVTNDWSEEANWKEDAIPVIGNDILFREGDVLNGKFTSNNDLGITFYRSIQFEGGDFIVTGKNALQIGDGGISSTGFGADNRLELPLDLLTTGLDVSVGLTSTLRLDRTLSGGDTGSGGFFNKSGSGTLVLSGANTYASLTRVLAGTLRITKASALGVGGDFAHQTSIFDGATFETVGTLSNVPEFLSFGSAGGPSSVVWRQSGGTTTWNGSVDLGDPTAIRVSTLSDQLEIRGSLASLGAATLTKTGAGRLILAGSGNQFTAEAFVNEGFLTVRHPTALGSSFSGTVVASTATLELEGGVNIANEPLTLQGRGVVESGPVFLGNLRSVSGANTWGGPITLDASTTEIRAEAGSTLTVSGGITGASNEALRVSGPGKTIFPVANPALAGSVIVAGGTLNVRNGQALGSTGGQTTVRDVGTLEMEGTFDVVGEAVNLGIASVPGSTGALRQVSGSVVWTGPVNLGRETTITTEAGGTLTIGGVISGIGTGQTLTKAGTGTLVFTGDQSNTYIGDTFVNEGTLRLNKINGEFGQALAMGSANLFVGDGIGGVEADRVVYDRSNQLPDAIHVHVNNSGVLNLNNQSDVIGRLTLDAGHVSTGTGTLSVSQGGAAVTSVAASAPAIISGRLDILTRGSSLEISDGTAAVDLQLDASLDGDDLQKDGGGRVVHTGQLRSKLFINKGVWKFDGPGASTTSNVFITVADGATMEMEGGVALNLTLFSLTGQGLDGTGALRSLGGNNSITGSSAGARPFLASGATQIHVGAGQLSLERLEAPAFFVSGPGPTNLSLTGAGTLVVSGDYLVGSQDSFTVNSGTLLMNGGPGKLGSQQSSAIPVTVNGGTLGGTGTVGAITVNSGILAPGNSAGILTAHGDVILSPRGTFRVELNGTRPGSGHDQVNMPVAANQIFLNGANLDVTLGFSSAVGSEFKIIDNAGLDRLASTDQFAQGDSITVGGVKFAIFYRGGDSNDVVLKHASTSPTFINRSVTSPIREGDTATLTGTIVDPDPLDRFFLDVNWGDGIVKTFEFGPGANGTTVNITHTYEDEDDDDTYVIHLVWRDDHAISNSAELEITVHNVDPTVEAGSREVLKPNGRLQRTGTFTDPGADTWTGTVDYGDGTGEQLLKLLPGKRFQLHHDYQAPGEYTVTVTVTDDDGGVGTDVFVVIVPGKGNSGPAGFWSGSGSGGRPDREGPRVLDGDSGLKSGPDSGDSDPERSSGNGKEGRGRRDLLDALFILLQTEDKED